LPNEPESTTLIPPNLTEGAFVFKVIVAAPTCTMDAVVYVNEAVPLTERLPFRVRSCVNVGPTYEAVNAVVAYEAVPKSEPVMPPVTEREPVMPVDCN
jgi:methylthioribose-1-phosphate isomerase